MTHPLLRRADVDFLLFDWLRLEGLLEHGKFADHNRETIGAILDLSERLAADVFLPHYKASDSIEPYLDADGVHVLPAIGDALRQYAELGLFSASFPSDLGGFGLPFSVSAISYAWFAAANIATSAYVMLTGANARLIAAFGSPAQVEAFALPQIEGRWFGTMCLSEPQAGSNLGEVQTRAVREGEDELGARYRLVGNKMWISGGDQDISENIVHLVLAKVPDADGHLPSGTSGISLFIVPRTLPDGSRNDLAVAGLNHKMGYRGTSNCLLNFGENEGATGWLVGSVGEGLRQMFMMMNEARISVGFGAAALAYRGYQHALAYATERGQGRKQADGPQTPIIEHADVRRMLLAQKCYAEGSLALCLYSAMLVDQDEDPDNAALLSLLTPIAKTWPSEFGLMANDLAIQVHGGYGYTRDFDVEQLYRDNRLNPIHEGTTGIQGMDLLGRKILREGKGLEILRARIARTIEATADQPGLGFLAMHLRATWREIHGTIQLLKQRPPARMLDDATSFLFGFGHAVMGWLWLDQAVVATRALPRLRGEALHVAQGKIAACEYFYSYELPKVSAWLAPVNDGHDIMRAPVDVF
ncbi:MAG: acyl-CoA dehydrogenase [Alphaproteobacteria bacterium]|nr:acyl-CoA dehydrogenase [Alphaproteobacteria bacterium]